MDQLSFASLDYAAKKKRTRDVFLAEMAAAVPWITLEALIKPRYPRTGPNGVNFRHLLERHELTKTIFVAIAEYL